MRRNGIALLRTGKESDRIDRRGNRAELSSSEWKAVKLADKLLNCSAWHRNGNALNEAERIWLSEDQICLGAG